MYGGLQRVVQADFTRIEGAAACLQAECRYRSRDRGSHLGTGRHGHVHVVPPRPCRTTCGTTSRSCAWCRTDSGSSRPGSISTGSPAIIRSPDRGRTWEPVLKTPVWGYPQHLLPLRDGRLLMTYGYRRPPFGVRACLSSDYGQTWDVANEIILRMDGGTPPGQTNGKSSTCDLGLSHVGAAGRRFHLHCLLSQHGRQQLLHRRHVLETAGDRAVKKRGGNQGSPPGPNDRGARVAGRAGPVARSVPRGRRWAQRQPYRGQVGTTRQRKACGRPRPAAGAAWAVLGHPLSDRGRARSQAGTLGLQAGVQAGFVSPPPAWTHAANQPTGASGCRVSSWPRRLPRTGGSISLGEAGTTTVVRPGQAFERLAEQLDDRAVPWRRPHWLRPGDHPQHRDASIQDPVAGQLAACRGSLGQSGRGGSQEYRIRSAEPSTSSELECRRC